MLAADATQMLLIYPIRTNADSGYFPHVTQKAVAETTAAGEKEPRAVTSGNFTVTEIVDWDEENHIMYVRDILYSLSASKFTVRFYFSYFIGTQASKPGVRHLFSVPDLSAGDEEDRNIKCILCHEEPPTEDEPVVRDEEKSSTETDVTEVAALEYCEYNSVSMSPSREYFVQNCLGPGVPFSRVLSLPGGSEAEAEEVAVLDVNANLRAVVNGSAMPKEVNFELELEDSDTPARVRLYIPPGRREPIEGEPEEFMFPLVVNV